MMKSAKYWRRHNSIIWFDSSTASQRGQMHTFEHGPIVLRSQLAEIQAGIAIPYQVYEK